MKTRRLGLAGVCAAIAALVMSACGSSPYLPPAVTPTSPYTGTSAPFIGMPGTGIGNQQAKVRICSIGGGPLSVHVHHPEASEGTQLSVRAISTDLEAGGDEADATIFDVTHPSPTVTVDTYFESDRDLRAGECADVILLSNYNLLAPGPSFSFTITR